MAVTHFEIPETQLKTLQVQQQSVRLSCHNRLRQMQVPSDKYHHENSTYNPAKDMKQEEPATWDQTWYGPRTLEGMSGANILRDILTYAPRWSFAVSPPGGLNATSLNPSGLRFQKIMDDESEQEVKIPPRWLHR